MRANLLDFGAVKVVQPVEPLTGDQLGRLRAALSLAGRGLRVAALSVVATAGLTAWPPKKRRTTTAWTTSQVAFALEHHDKMDAYQLARSISALGPERSATAVEKFLNQRGRKVMWISVGRLRGERLDAPPRPKVRDGDSAYVAAVKAARERGFAW